MEGETVQTEVCSDVEKELRAIEVLKPLFATQKEGATPKKGSSPSPKKMEEKKGGKPLPKSDFPLKGTKVANVHSQNEKVSINRQIILRNKNKLE